MSLQYESHFLQSGLPYSTTFLLSMNLPSWQWYLGLCVLGCALAPEFTIDEFQKIAEYDIGEESEMMEQMHCGFVECNIGQIGHFTDHLETARISSESRVGIVTTSAQIGSMVRQTLEKLLLKFMGILATSSRDGDTAKSPVGQCNAV